MQIPAITSTYPISQQRKLITSPFADGFDFSSYLDQSSPIASATSKFRETVLEKVAIEMEKLWDDPESTTEESSQGSSRNPLDTGDSITINSMVERAITTTAQEQIDGKITILSSDGDGVSSIMYNGSTYTRVSGEGVEFVFRSTDGQSPIKYADGKYMLQGQEIPVATSTSSVQDSNIDKYTVQDTDYDSNGLKTITIGGVTYKRVDDENGAENIFVAPDGTRYLYKNNNLVELSNDEDLTNKQTAKGTRVLLNNDAFIITDGYIGAQYINMKNAITGQALETAKKLGESFKDGKSYPIYSIGSDIYSYENGAFKKHNTNFEVGGSLTIQETGTDDQITYHLGRTIEKISAEEIVVRAADGTEEIYSKLSSEDYETYELRDDLNFYRRGADYYVQEGSSLVKIGHINDPKYKLIYQETGESIDDLKLRTDKGTIYIKGGDIYNDVGLKVTNDPEYYKEFMVAVDEEETDENNKPVSKEDFLTNAGVSADQENFKFADALISSDTKGYDDLPFVDTYTKGQHYLIGQYIYEFTAGTFKQMGNLINKKFYNLSSGKDAVKPSDPSKMLKLLANNKAYHITSDTIQDSGESQETVATANDIKQELFSTNGFLHVDYHWVWAVYRAGWYMVPKDDNSSLDKFVKVTQEELRRSGGDNVYSEDAGVSMIWQEHKKTIDGTEHQATHIKAQET